MNKPKKLDLLEAEAFRRWVQYTKMTNFGGIDWPTWKQAWFEGLIV